MKQTTKDILSKAGWTVAQLVVTTAIVVIGDIDHGWGRFFQQHI